MEWLVLIVVVSVGLAWVKDTSLAGGKKLIFGSR